MIFLKKVLCAVEAELVNVGVHDGVGLLDGGVEVAVQERLVQPELQLVHGVYAAALAEKRPEINALLMEGVV